MSTPYFIALCAIISVWGLAIIAVLSQIDKRVAKLRKIAGMLAEAQGLKIVD